MNIAIKLDKKTRDALPASQFAVATSRKLPINDEHHTRLAWDMVDKTAGLSADERRTARERILARAKELNVDTTDWNKVRAMRLEGMALNISADEHPNKMPFSGVLTKIDQPSDAPPKGSGGRLVLLTRGAAERALSSLLGMAVNFTPSFDGHDAKEKIGIITSAEIVGNELRIEGFVYAADFPETAELIQKLKDVLGFSFEAQRILVEDMGADVLRIIDLIFTGAAILQKDKAAYTTTRLAAEAGEGDLDMTAEELKALMGPLLADAIRPITDRLTVVETSNKTITDTFAASAAIRAKVEPHAVALEAAATAMEAAGVGTDPKTGSAALRQAAATMRVEASQGRLPASLIAGGTTVIPAVANDAAAMTTAIEAALKPVKEDLAATKTQLTDAVNKARLSAAAPERRTAPQVASLLSKAGITLPEEGKTLSAAEVDTALAKVANLNIGQKIMLKNELARMGAMAS